MYYTGWKSREKVALYKRVTIKIIFMRLIYFSFKHYRLVCFNLLFYYYKCTYIKTWLLRGDKKDSYNALYTDF